MYGINDPNCPVDIEKLINSLIQHEGLKSCAYDDANGQPIISGYTVIGNPTAGVGRLLTMKKGLSNEESRYLLGNDIRSAIGEAEAQSWWTKVKDSDPRARALIELIFNLGLGGLKNFTHALAAIDSGNYALAADEFLNSKWARQVKGRAQVLTEMIRTGQDSSS